MADDELLGELKRVGSDLTFRRWTRHRVKIIALLVTFDLLVSVVSVLALLGVHHVQRESCQRDNQLRQAYVAQWQPVLDQPPAPLSDNPTAEEKARYEAGLQTRQQFQESLKNGFAQHGC